MEQIKACKQLQFLNLGRTRITDKGLEHLAALAQLHELDLWGAPVTIKGLKRFQQALPNCQD